MNLAQFQFLTSQTGRRLLDEYGHTAINPENHLQIASKLRQKIDPTNAQAVIETLILRRRAAAKFERAAQMYFTRPALEQASSEIIAHYRARRFFQAHFKVIIDLGCSIGGDALALAKEACVIGIDSNRLRLEIARQNVATYNGNNRFLALQADLNELPPIAGQALFFDPARRDERGNRIKSVALYRPPLNLIDRWREKVAHAAVKISPGVAYEEIPPQAEAEFISLAGAVKEALLWYGDLRQGIERRATLLPGNHTLTSADYPGPDVPITEPDAYLYEPDGAIIRAHLVQNLARALEAGQIDSQIAYLTSGKDITTPFARGFKVEDWFPFQLKRLRHYLRSRRVGHVTVKKRGSPLEPQWLATKLRLKGDQKRVLFLTQVKGKPAVIVAYDPQGST